MNPFRRRLLAATAVAPLWSSALAQKKAFSSTPRALGYVPWWMAEAWRDMPLAQLDRLVLFEAAVQPRGAIDDNDWGSRVPELAAFARARALPLDIALTLHGHVAFERVFRDAAARRRLAGECERWLAQPYIAGLHLDIEGYASAERGAVLAFREWLGAVDATRKAAGKGLSAFFPADDHFTPYDAASAARVDFWVAQVYDAHSADGGKTGPLITRLRDNPVAVPRALPRLSALRIARKSVLLSVPLYGFEWPAEAAEPEANTAGRGRLLTYAHTPAKLMPDDRGVATELSRIHGLRRDAEHTPYYSYAEGAAWKQGWYEDMESLTRKLAPERGRGYGLAFFPLGYDRNQIVEPFLRWWRTPAAKT